MSASSLPAPESSIESNLQGLLDKAPRIALGPEHRLVILSDLHLGDGGVRDDFRHNAELVHTVLREHYLRSGYSLVLNGDIEELQRFKAHVVHERWRELYTLFEEFRRQTALYKLVGNHDGALRHLDGAAHRPQAGPLLDALRFVYRGNTLFVFHGHQATIFFERFNFVSGIFLRYFAKVLRIRSVPVTYESQRKYRIEHRVYDFSTRRGIVSIIGHTHRPLFESLSMIDTLQFRIEQLCRDYPEVSPLAQKEIEAAIEGYRQQLALLWERDREEGLRGSLYNEQLCIPCLFNSGCAVGKRGVTAIEIADGSILLVHWSEGAPGEDSVGAEEQATQRLGSTDYLRTVLKQDRLDYVFARIKLLT